MDKHHIVISQEGLEKLAETKANKDPSGKNFLWTTDIDTELPIFTNPGNPHTCVPPKTMGQMFHKLVKEIPNHQFMFEYDKTAKFWRSMTLSEMDEIMKKMARAFVKLDIPTRSCIGILAHNSIKWALAFYGSVMSDIIPTGLYNTNSPETCFQVLNDCHARAIFVDDIDQYNKILKIQDQLPNLKYIFTFDKLDMAPNPKVITFDDLVKLGEEKTNSLEEEIHRRLNSQKPGKCVTLIYTSGTTGEPKGVMLSHDNITFLLSIVDEFKYSSGMRVVSYLPLSHIAGLFMDLITILYTKGCVYFADKEALRGTLPWYLQEVKPHVFLGVPRVFEKIADTIKHTVNNSNPIRKAIFNWSLKQGFNEQEDVLNHREPTWRYKLAKKLVFDKLKAKIGIQNVEHFLYGAAPMKEETRKFFYSLGIALNNLYGLSETTGAISGLTPNNYHEFHMKSCGKPFDGVEIIIGNEEEILFKSRTCFMGYLNKENDTKSVIDSLGRVHSGDMGKLDEKKNLFITGRLKELLITAGGENVAPYPIENHIIKKLGGFISWAIVIGDKKPFLSLLLSFKNKNDPSKIPDDELEPHAIQTLKQHGIAVTKLSEILNNPEHMKKISKLVNEAIDYANEQAISKACFIRKWAILPRDLAMATDDLTPTMKLKRRNIEKHFKNVIHNLYMEPKL